MASNLQSPLLWQALQFGAPNAWLDWLGVHQQWHRELAINSGKRFCLFDDMKENLELHAIVHDELASHYGVSPVGDLVSFDLNDEASWQGFH